MLRSDEVPTSRKIAQIAAAAIFCLLCAGLPFGFAALKPVLIAEGVYSDACRPELAALSRSRGRPDCPAQDSQLNSRIFVAATVVTNVAALPVGLALDKLGPRWTSLIGAVLFGLGNLLFGLRIQRSAFDGYTVGFVLIALGGPCIFLPSLHLSNAFPRRSGLILSLLTGAFDASSLPCRGFVVFRALFDATAGAVDIRRWFLWYLVVPISIVLEQLLIAPPSAYQRGLPEATVDAEDEPTERTALRPNAEGERGRNPSSFGRVHYGDDHHPGPDQDKLARDPLNGVMFDSSAAQQILSSWWALITVFLCLHMLRINLYIASAFDQLLAYTGDVELAEKLTSAFTLLLPLGGAAGVPVIGLLLDRRPSRDAFLVLFVLGLLFGGLCASASPAAQIVGIVCFVILRPLMYTVVSDFCAKAFGFCTFGTVYGLINTVGGLFGLVQRPIDVAIKQQLDGDYSVVNWTLGALCAVSALAMAWRAHSVSRDRPS